MRETRSLSTIKYDTKVLHNFVFKSERFVVRSIQRPRRPIYLVTSFDLNENMINETKLAPIAEFTFTSSNRLRCSYRPSKNYPRFLQIEDELLAVLEELFSNTVQTYKLKAH